MSLCASCFPLPSKTRRYESSVSPGGVTATSVLVTSATSAAANFYTVGVKGANSSAPTYAATANGTVAVATALTVAVATDKATMSATMATTAPILARAFKTPEYYASRGSIAFRPPPCGVDHMSVLRNKVCPETFR